MNFSLPPSHRTQCLYLANSQILQMKIVPGIPLLNAQPTTPRSTPGDMIHIGDVDDPSGCCVTRKMRRVKGKDTNLACTVLRHSLANI